MANLNLQYAARFAILTALGSLGCGTDHSNGSDQTGGMSSVAGDAGRSGGALNGAGGQSVAAGGSAGGSVAQGGTAVAAGAGGSTVGGAAAAGAAPVSNSVPKALADSLSAAAAFDGPQLSAAYPITLAASLGYDPKIASGLDLIQGSALALNADELDKYGRQGFVISKARQFPTFSYGYRTIYSQDLPVYVSADSILQAVHHSFDDFLMTIEQGPQPYDFTQTNWQQGLIGQLDQLLTGMRAQLASASFEASLRADIDLYLTLAQSLLKGSLLAGVAGADAAQLKALYDLATAGAGHQTVSWFGSSRDEDFSQFKPRGHYTKSVSLGRYFRAMMLLGRVDLRLIETTSGGGVQFHRQQFDAALAFRELMQEPERKLWLLIDNVVGAFVGEHDSLVPSDLEGLLAALGVKGLEAARALDDQRIMDEIERGGWGAQRIASRIIVNGTADGRTLPLDRSFTLFGQRYTVDSHVFVNTTYDRVSGRLMASPLDVAFAALGNDAALELLSPGFGNTSYVQGLAKSRVLVDAHESAYWEGSLYTTWLSALRALAPTAKTLSQLPSVAKTRAFQNRILSSELASWAELRHDTILYAKQAYGSGVSCEFPDAYVDPYPELYARLGRFGERLDQVLTALPDELFDAKTRDSANAWVKNFKTSMGYLQRMAEDQVAGTPHSQELLDFVNEAVRWDETQGCGGPSYSNISGWYVRLFLQWPHNTDFDPTIADVYTQPTDEAGNDVGRILHVGTGYPRLMVVSVDTCSGPRAYAGLASSYGETIEQNWTRLTDGEWSTRISKGPFPDVPWLKDVLGN